MSGAVVMALGSHPGPGGPVPQRQDVEARRFWTLVRIPLRFIAFPSRDIGFLWEIRIMTHADETRRRWETIRWVDAVCERWEALFESLQDEPYRAEALCALGLKLIVEGGLGAWPQSATGGWVSFFNLLADCPETANGLCRLGLAVVRRELERNEVTRSKVRAILWACCLQDGRGSREAV